MGGHTSCVAITHSNASRPTLILDAGTGLRRVSHLMGHDPFHGTVIVGHLHWDHVMGLPFFPAGDRPDARVQLLVPEQGVPAFELLSRMMSPPFFPIGPQQLRGDWTFGTYDDVTMELEGFTVTARDIPHKGGRTMGLRVSDGHSTMAYLSDHAPTDLGPGDDGLGVFHEAALELVAGVDVLVHDAQYTAHEFPAVRNWGHCTPDYAVNLAAASGVRRLVLFHHDPRRTDTQVEEMRRALIVPEDLIVDNGVEGLMIQI